MLTLVWFLGGVEGADYQGKAEEENAATAEENFQGEYQKSTSRSGYGKNMTYTHILYFQEDKKAEKERLKKMEEEEKMRDEELKEMSDKMRER